MANKVQPWKAAWPAVEPHDPANATTSSDASIEYGIAKGDIAVVDGTAANVKPAAPLRLEHSFSSSATPEKTQPWKASWPGAEAPASNAVTEYGVTKGDIAVVDGTAANVKPSTRKTVRVVRE
ncbi:hypothetical protein SEUCBS139899_000640 [Sporothrix eucalyptigena]|uniref:Hypervirulence associated protein TUDOR domain-containing protein n=1 Tax=Sporothrix eucalyptigena TaxID=1812306 RepID=A0ABP0CRJ9_9PEZI